MPRLLAGGNPQIAKADGHAPVRAYIAAMPDWKRGIGRRLDALIARQVPHVRRAVKRNSPFYGIDGQGWFMSFHVFTRCVKVTFFKGTSLRPPAGGGKSREARWIDIHEDDFNEPQLADWIRQAAAMPGWDGSSKEDRLHREITRVFTRLAATALLLLLASSIPLVAADLRIKDSRGTEVVVTNASIDYSSFTAGDKESDGIRVLQGDGVVTVKWTDVQSIVVVRTDDSVRPPRIELEVVLKNGRKVAAALYRQGQMKLVGKTELGEYAIELAKVRSITPVR